MTQEGRVERNEEEWSRAVLDALAAAVITTDEGGIVESATRRVESVFGFRPSETVGRRIDSLIPGMDFGDRRPDARRSGGWNGCRKDGTLFPMDACIGSGWYRGRRIFTVLVRQDACGRRDVAAYLHDNTAQDLAFARIRLGLLLDPRFPPRIRKLAAQADEYVDRSIRSLRELMERPEAGGAGADGLSDTLHGMAERFRREHAVRVLYRQDGVREPVDPASEALVLRTVRELLCNVAKHSGAERVEVCLEYRDGSLLVSVEDDGIGFDPSCPAPHAEGHGACGKHGVLELVRRAGGIVKIDSAPGRGARVSVELPCGPCDDTR